jgi:hypothetical protein
VDANLSDNRAAPFTVKAGILVDIYQNIRILDPEVQNIFMTLKK